MGWKTLSYYFTFVRLHSPQSSFRAQREIFLALCSFLLLSQKVSPFPLSHIRLYPLLQERSLDFARDDIAEVAFSQHPLYTERGLSIPIPSFLAKSRNHPCTPLFLASFAKGFPFSAITHTTLSPPARKIPRLRSGWRCESSVFPTYPSYGTWVTHPPYRHFERSEKSSLHSALSCFLRRWIPVFCYHTYDIIPSCQKDPSTSVGMTMRMALCSRYFHAATPKSASSRHIDPSLWPAPSLRRAKKGS